MDQNKEEVEDFIKTYSTHFLPPPATRHIPKKYPTTMTFKRFEPLTDTIPIELFKEKLPVNNFETEMQELKKIYDDKDKNLEENQKDALVILVPFMRKFLEVYDLRKDNYAKLVQLDAKLHNERCCGCGCEDEE